MMIKKMFRREFGSTLLKVGSLLWVDILNLLPVEKTDRHIVVFKDEKFYSCFPVLYQLSNGILVTEFSTREIASHIDPRGGKRQLISEDGGLSWREHIQKIYNPNYRASDGKMVDANAYGWRFADPDERGALEKQGIEVRNSPNGQVAFAMGCYGRISMDEGKSWDQKDLDSPRKGLIMTYLDPCTYVRLDDQIVLRAVYGRPEANKSFYESWLLRTMDNGLHWEFQTLASDKNGVLGFGETALVKLGDTEIFTMMRLQPTDKWKQMDKKRNLYWSRSRDAGKTWTSPKDSGIEGYPASVILLRDGRLLCTYGYRETPMGIRAVVSNDKGESWNLGHIKTIRDDGQGRGADLGYPISIQREDGRIFTIYYFTGSEGITHIAGTIWDI